MPARLQWHAGAQVDAWGCTWIAVAVQIDPDSLYLSDTTAQIYAVTVEPCTVIEDAGLDIVQP